jgi:phosphoribosylformylglycinamidine (FGAM) synthase-like amidotransferase family enzyme
MGEVARMKLTPNNMRAMCDWVVADRSVFSHRFEDGDSMMVSIDTAEGNHVIHENQWLVKDDEGKFKVTDK